MILRADRSVSDIVRTMGENPVELVKRMSPEDGILYPRGYDATDGDDFVDSFRAETEQDRLVLRGGMLDIGEGVTFYNADEDQEGQAEPAQIGLHTQLTGPEILALLGHRLGDLGGRITAHVDAFANRIVRDATNQDNRDQGGGLTCTIDLVPEWVESDVGMSLHAVDMELLAAA